MMAENPADRVLSKEDIPTLINILTPVAWKCSALGLQLGLKDWQIKNIDKNRHDCESQLQEILVERLNQEEPLSWRYLVTALRSDSVREHRVAKRIESHYLTSQSLLSSTQQQRPNVSLPHSDTSLSSSSSQLPSQQNPLGSRVATILPYYVSLPPQYLPQQSHVVYPHIPHTPTNLPYPYFPLPYQHGPSPQVATSAVSPHNVPETGGPCCQET
jgi:hypothetical protein